MERHPESGGRSASAWDRRLPTRHDVVPILALTVAYLAAGKFGLSFASQNALVSAIWPATGVALAALLAFGLRLWPGVLLGAVLVNATTAATWPGATAIGIGNTLEAVMTSWLMMRYAGGASAFIGSGSLLRFLLAAALGTSVSASAGVCTLALGHSAAAHDLPVLWLTWWLGDLGGAAIVTPLLLLWRFPGAGDSRRSRLEGGLLILASGLIAADVFAAPWSRHYPMAILTIPPLMWAAFRFGPRVSILCAAGFLVPAVLATLRGSGPFALGTPGAALVVLQAFMITVTLTTMVIAALVRENRQALHTAEYAAKARQESLAMLSHELRNPLQAISSATALLKHVAGGDSPTGTATKVIERQTAHLARLVNDLLEVSRALEGSTVLDCETVNLGEAIEACLASFRMTNELKDHAIEVDTEPLWLRADPVRLQQILRNLLTNAVKYTPAGKSIRISARAADGNAVIAVVDQGAGISADLLPRIFDLFAQGESGLARSRGGLGVGLTLARQLVEQHGGTIEAQSEGLGRGSQFIVRMPGIEPPPLAADPAHSPEVPRGGLRILLIEDNPDARETMSTLLAVLGHEVHTAQDGPGGVEAALRIEPALALVDIGLPGMDGYGVARQLRSKAPCIRLVAMTGYGGEQDRHNTRAAGFDAHLVKPVGLEQLKHVLEGGSA